MSATSNDVARVAGVSQATVSRVLAGSAVVSEETRRRVLAAVDEVGYSPNLLARAMKTRRTQTVGVVVAQLSNPFYPEVLQALGAALESRSQRMVLWNTEAAGEAAALEAISAGLVDGLIFTNGTSDSPALQEAVAARAPIALVNRSVPELPGDQVTSENAKGAVLVAEHLLDLGHRRIGFLGGPPQPSTVSERREGFEAALRERGTPLDPELCRFAPLSYEHGRSATRELLTLPVPPTALFCVNDVTAFGALDAAREAGVPVPSALSIVGYDDVGMAAWEAFRLTTVRQPIDEMARRAVELLLERIEQPGLAPRHERFAAEFIARATTTAPAR